MCQTDNIIRYIFQPLRQDSGIITVNDASADSVQATDLEGVWSQFVCPEDVTRDVRHHQWESNNVHPSRLQLCLAFRINRARTTAGAVGCNSETLVWSLLFVAIAVGLLGFFFFWKVKIYLLFCAWCLTITLLLKKWCGSLVMLNSENN